MTDRLLAEMIEALEVDGTGGQDAPVRIEGEGALSSFFEVTALAAASFGVAGAMLSRLAAGAGADPAGVIVDRRLASLWFGFSLHPTGWQRAPIWDSVAGDYRARNGWIRLHTNAPHHRAAALAVLGVDENRDAVAAAVAAWRIETLEAAVVEAGGCAAAMRRFAGWVRHPQGSAVAREPLVIWREHAATPARRLPLAGSRPLEGLRVLDLTRVLAGPAATRFLAGFGADVLRIDPPGWEETAAVQEMTLGKRCARLNLGAGGDRATFETLLASADVLVHGYRSGALSALGYGDEQRRALNPGLTDVALNAYGWSGPWSDRRGFDSLVQMSSGIADFGMRQAAGDRPAPLPVQALDHATGYLVAAAILKALVLRREQGRVVSARLSLARTAHLLAGTRSENLRGGLAPATLDDLDLGVEDTVWGPARRVRFPLKIDGLAVSWPYPAGPLGASRPEWADAP